MAAIAKLIIGTLVLGAVVCVVVVIASIGRFIIGMFGLLHRKPY